MFEENRIRALTAALRQNNSDVMLVTHPPDVQYLTGFTGSSAVLAVHAGTRAKARLFTDGRYTAQARDEVHSASVRIAPQSALVEACAYAARNTVRHCVFDPLHTTVSAQNAMRKTMRAAGAPAGFLKPIVSPIATLRMVKDPGEAQTMRRAAALTCDLYTGMLSWIEAGMRERDVAAELEYRARRAGADRMSFETIIAAGERSGQPHARASVALLRPGQLLTLDFGIVLDGYCSDMTRTVALGFNGKPVPAALGAQWREQRAVFDAVLEAQEAAVRAIRPGATCGAVDHAARSILKRAGLARYFSHSTGHGVGLEIHEGPRVTKRQSQVLQAGMVITIEPGAYLPGRFGVRIEDTVLVTETGAEILTPVYKGWTEL